MLGVGGWVHCTPSAIVRIIVSRNSNATRSLTKAAALKVQFEKRIYTHVQYKQFFCDRFESNSRAVLACNAIDCNAVV